MTESLIPAETRAVFFDAVGTLIAPEPPAEQVYQAVGRRHGCLMSLEAIILRFREAFRFEEEDDAEHEWAVSEERERRRWRNIVGWVFHGRHGVDEIFDELWEHFARPEAWSVADHAGQVLSNLADRGYILGIATNFDRRLHSVVDGLPALAPIRQRVISSEVGKRKPAKEFFTAVVRAADCAAREVLYVGDRRDVDYEAANAAGLRGVLLDPSRDELPSIRRIRRMTDLLNLL